MRTNRRVQWPCIAIALAALSPSALADSKKKIADCTSFDERELDDDAGVAFTISNQCEATLSCGIKWTLTCAPRTKKSKKTRQSEVFVIESGQSDGTSALAECGYDGWEITDVSWSCDPPR